MDLYTIAQGMQSDFNIFFWARVGEMRHHQRGEMTFAYQHSPWPIHSLMAQGLVGEEVGVQTREG